MSDQIPLPAVAPGAVTDGSYVVDVVGGVITGLSPVGAGGGIASVVAGTGIAVDSTDPANPVVSATGGGGGARPLVMPQGSLQRKYTFDADTQGWVAAAGVLSWDSTRTALKHVPSATGASQIILEPSSAASLANGEVVLDLTEVANSASQIDTGLVFRAADASNCYLLGFRIGASTLAYVELFKVVAGTFTSLGGAAAGNTNLARMPVSGVLNFRMMARFVGGHIRAYINETFIGAWNDTTHTTGRVGVRGFANAASGATYWDNVAAYSLASTWKPPAYD